MANGKHWMTPSRLPRAKMLALERCHVHRISNVAALNALTHNPDLPT